MAEIAETIVKINKDLKESNFKTDEKRVLTEVVDILGKLNGEVESLDLPSRQLVQILDDFGGTENPLFMFIAFIFKHLDDYFSDGVLGDFLDFDDVDD